MEKMAMTGQSIRNGAIAALVVTVAGAYVAQAAPVEDFRYDAQSSKLSFVLPEGVQPRYFLMAQPARIVVDLPDTQIGDLPAEQSFSGAVRRISVAQVQPQLARIILEMSPKAVFARGQVSLENVGDATPKKERWVLRPLLVTANAQLPIQQPRPVPATALPERSALPPMEPPPAVVPTMTDVTSAPVAARPVVKAKPAPAVELPPGMESVVGNPPLPVAPLERSTPVLSKPATPPALPDLSTSTAAPADIALPNAKVPLAQLPTEPVVQNEAALKVPPPPPLFQGGILNSASVASVPHPDSPAAMVMPKPAIRADLKPPAQHGAVRRPQVSVPPLSSIGISTNPSRTSLPNTPPLPSTTIAQAMAGQSTDVSSRVEPPSASITLPTSDAADDLPPLPQVSPRADVNDRSPSAVIPTSSLFNPTSVNRNQILPVRQTSVVPTTGVVEFGQRLPSAPALVPSPVRANPASLQSGISNGAAVVALDNLTTGGVVVPAGTLLSLRYDQTQALRLNPGQRQQTVLRLQSPIVDSQGRVVVARGSLVSGEFATSKDGSQFTAQVLSTLSRNLPFNAQSSLLQSTKRVSNNSLLQNSGIGAVAGAILGGLNGSVLGGAAAGAAITYAVSPKETTLQPGQVVQVKLVNDFLSAR